MKHLDMENQIPCIIENGIVYSLKDIYRLLRDMGHVRYMEIVNGETRTAGEGYIMSVVANSQSATIIANRRLYLNVCSFDYMILTTLPDGEVHFDLVNAHRTVRLLPVADAIHEDGGEDKPERFEEYDTMVQEDLAEIQLEDDDDVIEGD